LWIYNNSLHQDGVIFMDHQ